MALANQEAQRFNHEYIGTEHLLLGLVKEGAGVGANVLKSFDLDLRKVRLEVERLIKAGPEVVTMGRVPQTPRVKKVIEYAIEEALGLKHNHVGTEHLLLGLIREHDGVAGVVLIRLGVDLTLAREAILRRMGSTAHAEGSPAIRRRNDCDLCRRMDQIERWPHNAIAVMSETAAVLADNQGCRGWCVLILQEHVEHLAELSKARQTRIFLEVASVTAAIREVFPTSGKDGGPPRINYECLGNLVPHVHWHVIPRHADDPEPTRPVWGWPEGRLKGSMTEVERQELIEKLRAALSGM
jgi:diadenosine tetraphosphate (Ap4A) HIT family hydrolase